MVVKVKEEDRKMVVKVEQEGNTPPTHFNAGIVKKEESFVDVKPNIKNLKPKKRGGKKKEENKKKILAYLVQMHKTLDRKVVPKKEIAEAIGYSAPGSHPFFYAYQALVKEGMILRGELTDLGFRSAPAESLVFAKPKTNKEKQESFFKLLRKRVKEGTDEKVTLIFDILSDGKTHKLNEFTRATGYANLKSKGLGYNMNYMEKDMKILEKIAPNTWQFTDKCFPNGRPE